VPPEWHSWLQHIRKEPPTNDLLMQNLTPPWKAVSSVGPFPGVSLNMCAIPAILRKPNWNSWGVQAIQHSETENRSLGGQSEGSRLDLTSHFQLLCYIAINNRHALSRFYRLRISLTINSAMARHEVRPGDSIPSKLTIGRDLLRSASPLG